ncbi:hypothetical protein [Candidatus Nitrosocosmicus hydrocola]|uniref:hypothetical protein n=1 Tax=Candidatus Nitrosocosmicus hydrocola TaxID=1826872 RepID=UPI0011E5B199|nr:hypothetical protein [Candidatus Nitrosocosmicus hydrocola]
MNEYEEKIRNDINNDLEKLGFHLRLSMLSFDETESVHDYVPPIHDWFGEWMDVEEIVIHRIKSEQQKLGTNKS